MIYILLSSFSVGIGSYLLRRGDLIGLVLSILKRQPHIFNSFHLYTLSGIILNLAAVYFWQYSSKSQLPYQAAYSLYLSLALITGIITSALVERVNLGLNVLVGSFFVIIGIIILTHNN